MKFQQNRELEEKPLALFLSFGPPHDPYYVLPEGDMELFEEKELKLRGNCRDEIQL